MKTKTKKILEHIERNQIKIGSVVKADNGNVKICTEPQVINESPLTGEEAVICTGKYLTGRFKGEFADEFHLNEIIEKIK